MSRLWAAGEPIQVDADSSGWPQRIVWAGTQHRIDQISDHWRVDLEWWRGRIWRMYFVVVTTSGLLIELYHDLLADRWYLQRLYD